MSARFTFDPADPRLRRGADEVPVDQAEAYLVLSEADRRRGFVKPLRGSYRHTACGAVTTMAQPIAETYARDPFFYGATYCCQCRKHRPLFEFRWEPDGETMDPRDWPEAECERVRAEIKRIEALPRVVTRTLTDDGIRLTDRIR